MFLFIKSLATSILSPIMYNSNNFSPLSEIFIFNKKLCYTYPIEKKSHQRVEALGSSRKLVRTKLPNVLRCARPYPLGFFIVYFTRLMN